ncbi:disease resistance protein RPS4-like [Neltuma alba]|uniref:disease resistance protein RPS4-like n=1 Tax=Neltuma alba TaxID=207710 RepID=UPI0010A4ABFF|nr:disease resistance protein RPS4-like [Prosopis alba]
MKRSNVTKLWDGVQVLENLRTINLFQSVKLMELPDFSMARKLENVDLTGCTSLRSVHPSILSLHSLVKLHVSDCHELESLESETHLESLFNLRANFCGLKKLCLSSNKLESIRLLGTKLEILDLPIGRFTKLRRLSIWDGERLRSLPIKELCCLTNLEVFGLDDFEQEIHTEELRSLFDAWRNLTGLALDGCSYLSEIPGNIKCLTRLEYLSLAFSGVETLPACVSHLSSLTSIDLHGCERLKSILGLPPMLKRLNANYCPLLETVSSDSLVFNRCLFEFENCVKLDECSLGFIEELTHFSLTSDFSSYEDEFFLHDFARYPGNRVPKSLEQLPPVTCYITFDDIVTKSSTGYELLEELDSDHVFMWSMGRVPSGARTGDDVKISCEFFLEQLDSETGVCYSEVPAEACGVHVTYRSESEPGSAPGMSTLDAARAELSLLTLYLNKVEARVKIRSANGASYLKLAGELFADQRGVFDMSIISKQSEVLASRSSVFEAKWRSSWCLKRSGARPGGSIDRHLKRSGGRRCGSVHLHLKQSRACRGGSVDRHQKRSEGRRVAAVICVSSEEESSGGSVDRHLKQSSYLTICFRRQRHCRH